MTGFRGEHLEVICRAGNMPNGDAAWKCRCSCEKEFIASGTPIRRGNVVACGCRQFKANLRHGLSKHPLYKCWVSMIGRCQNSEHESYPRYGGRGIKVCERWQDLATFIADMEALFSRGLEIDRENVDGDYTPENCRFITPAEQNRNKTNHIKIGDRLFVDVCRENGISLPAAYKRVQAYGWTPERAATTPVRPRRRAVAPCQS